MSFAQIFGGASAALTLELEAVRPSADKLVLEAAKLEGPPMAQALALLLAGLTIAKREGMRLTPAHFFAGMAAVRGAGK